MPVLLGANPAQLGDPFSDEVHLLEQQGRPLRPASRVDPADQCLERGVGLELGIDPSRRLAVDPHPRRVADLLTDEGDGVVGQGLPGGGVGESLIVLHRRLDVVEHRLCVETMRLADRPGQVEIFVLVPLVAGEVPLVARAWSTSSRAPVRHHLDERAVRVGRPAPIWSGPNPGSERSSPNVPAVPWSPSSASCSGSTAGSTWS